VLVESVQTRKQSMKIYLNGDSHTAGAATYKNYCFANDDPEYSHLGELAHPKCLQLSYGYVLAKILNAEFFCEAISASSNSRILRKTNEFLNKKLGGELIVVIGWSTWEREEWLYNDNYYQVNGSGTDMVPRELEEQYKQWVTEQTRNNIYSKSLEWHDKIYELHKHLDSRNIKHLFFNSYAHFHKVPELDWHGCYLDPYSSEGTYWNWCKNQGYKLQDDVSHYGKDAHIAWAKFLLHRLTDTTNSSSIVTVRSANINRTLRVKK